MTNIQIKVWQVLINYMLYLLSPAMHEPVKKFWFPQGNFQLLYKNLNLLQSLRMGYWLHPGLASPRLLRYRGTTAGVYRGSVKKSTVPYTKVISKNRDS